MKKVNNNKGFSLAELLIVVAIIAVLVAIAIPAFGDQIERSRESVDLSALRNGYTEAATVMMNSSRDDLFYLYQMPIKQQKNDWQSNTSEFPLDLSDIKIDSRFNLAKELGTFSAATAGTDKNPVATFVFTFDRDEQKVSGVYVLGDPTKTSAVPFNTNAAIASTLGVTADGATAAGLKMDGKTAVSVDREGKIS